MILSEKAQKIKPYTAGEQPQGKAFIKLNTNENPYPPSPSAAKAISGFNADSLKLYPDPDSVALRKAIAAAEGVDERNIFTGNGSDEVLALLFRALFNPHGAPVAFADVTYSFYPVFCDLYDINYKTIALDSDYNLNAADYLNIENCGGIVIANPNAPTSIAICSGALEKIISGNPNLPVIIDEAYVDFAPVGSSCTTLAVKYKNLAVVKTFSKSYALAGMRCGYCIADSDIIDGLNRIKDSFNSYPLDRVCQAVCAAAVADREYFNQRIADVIKVRNYAADKLRAFGCNVAESGANFLFVKVKDGQSAYEKLKERGILVRYFNKPRLTDRLRITVGTLEEIDKLLNAMSEIELV